MFSGTGGFEQEHMVWRITQVRNRTHKKQGQRFFLKLRCVVSGGLNQGQGLGTTAASFCEHDGKTRGLLHLARVHSRVGSRFSRTNLFQQMFSARRDRQSFDVPYPGTEAPNKGTVLPSGARDYRRTHTTAGCSLRLLLELSLVNKHAHIRTPTVQLLRCLSLACFETKGSLWHPLPPPQHTYAACRRFFYV